ncbi:hypothetical protein ACFY12_25590 [Streptomyces sp. NPDC001339]|uniref:hypothetical protein n=1 Tax=Streptomyces sp. NPDC001339 TaxID=3364563 RepID=UPI003692CCFC
MNNAPVDPAEVPVFTGNLDVLETKIKAISSGGSKVETAGSDVHKSFGGLSAFYKAPEAEQLFGVTQPVADTAHDLSRDAHTIAGALGTYAREVRPLVKQLEQLKADAAAFRDKVDGDDKWREDGDLTDENLSRRNKIAEVWTAFQAAERDCHATIVALVGGKALTVNDGSNKQGMYGYDAEALKQSKSLPWGDAVEESVPWWQVWEHAYDFGKGVIVDGVWGTIKGLGTLIGFDGADAAGQAWKGLAQLATGVAITTLPLGLGAAFWAAPEDKLPSWLRESRTAMKETGKALVAWDQWGSNPSRAAGAVTFNVLTAIVTRGGGAAISGAGKAGTVAKVVSVAGKVGHAIDPMTYVFKGAGAGLSKIGDLVAHLKNTGHAEVPKISDGAYSPPEGSVELPDGTVQLPKDTPIPEGATRLPNGNVKLPDGTVTFPPNTLKDPFTGKYMHAGGDLYNKDGSLFQRAEDATKEKPAPTATGADNPRIETPAPQKQPALASVGGRGDDITRVGSDISDPVRTSDNAGHGSTGPGDNTPTGRVGDHGTPGGSAGDHMPTNSHTPGGGTAPHASGAGGLDNSTSGAGHTAETGGTRSGGHGSGDGPPIPHQGDGPVGTGTGHDVAGSSSAHADSPGAGNDTHAPAGDSPSPQRDPAARPSFMREGDNPYGPRGSLTREQIEEIQVYRANHEPGYFKDYYKGGEHLGDRKNLELTDESGFTPPQLTRLSDDGPLVRVKDTPEPPKPHFLDPHYLKEGADTVTDSGRRQKLEESARNRHFAIEWDKIAESLKKDAAQAHKTHGTFETGGLWGENKGLYKEAHTAMGKETEAFGETVAEHHYIAEHHEGAVRQPLDGPANGNDQFDQVWKRKDGGYVVVEAKSSVDTKLGARNLPNGKRVSQGSQEYFFDIIREMKKRGEHNIAERRLARNLEKALKSGKLEYVVVKGEKNSGIYTGYQYRRFDITKRSLP